MTYFLNYVRLQTLVAILNYYIRGEWMKFECRYLAIHFHRHQPNSCLSIYRSQRIIARNLHSVKHLIKYY